MSAITASTEHLAQVSSIYRRSLRLSLNWAVRRDIWRREALAIRARFEANKNVTDPRQVTVLLQSAEAELDANRHPDPYIPPSRPGGSKYERNAHPPLDEPVPGDY
ncbi:hypothetical protein V1514DRAFT_325901 [Lipomyces japonicus]|uniref:uncharacterized protein n=1 Tax=Lipomyces japonicus TaxID=56871 RepID=UPI0034CD0541